MSTDQPKSPNNGTPSRQPERSQSFPTTPPRRRPYESPAFPASDQAVSQADGAA